MAKFMYIFRGGAFVTPGLSPTEIQEHLQKWGMWIGGLAKAGHHRQGGYAVQTSAKTVKGRDRIITDGPYAESKDLVTGNLVVDAASLEKASELAQGCPIFLFDGSVEVRPILENET